MDDQVEMPQTGYGILRAQVSRDWLSFARGLAQGSFAPKGGGLAGFAYTQLGEHPQWLADGLLLAREVHDLPEEVLPGPVLRATAAAAMLEGLHGLARRVQNDPLAAECQAERQRYLGLQAFEEILQVIHAGNIDQARTQADLLAASHPELRARIAQEMQAVTIEADTTARRRIRVLLGAIGMAIVVGVSGCIIRPSPPVPLDFGVAVPAPHTTGLMSRANIRWCMQQQAVLEAVRPHIPANNVRMNQGYEADLADYDARCAQGQAAADDVQAVHAEPLPSDMILRERNQLNTWNNTPR